MALDYYSILKKKKVNTTKELSRLTILHALLCGPS